jgi:uncharacterized iron-regulated protein
MFIKKRFIYLGLFLILSIASGHSKDITSGIQYSLYADINPNYNILYGKAEITPDEEIEVDLSGLENIKINNVLFRTLAKSPKQASLSLQEKAQQSTLILKPGVKTTINYEYQLDSYAAYSDAENVSLSGAWYPQIKQLANYQLTANLPKGFQAISEADQITHEAVKYKRVEYQFSFAFPLDNLTLVASKNYKQKIKQLDNIQIETWFMSGNAHLADTYLDHAIDYLKLYQQMLGPYPYKRFAMVESPLPSGFSMPSYTLLGTHVISLPFIVKTSLGHEILHQWFGNSVYVDRLHGNWSEGLTTYLADYYYAVLQGLDKAYRKNILNEYEAYVNQVNSFPVREFIGRYNKASSVIGYGKVAMIFHQLNLYYGDELFFKAIRNFIKHNDFQKASWHDIQREFEALDGQSMYEDFYAWLTRDDIANISMDGVAELKLSQGKLWLNFSLQQQSPAYHLHTPLRLTYEDGSTQTKQLHFSQSKQPFSIELEEPPISVVIDPDFHLMRHLADNEKQASLAWLMGKGEKSNHNNILVVVDQANESLYQPIIEGLKINSEIINAKDLSFEQLKNHSLIITQQQPLQGFLQLSLRTPLNHNPPEKSIVDSLFASHQFSLLESKVDGVQVKIKRNPYNDNEVIMLLSASDPHQAKLAARKLSHYGKYNHLVFRNGELKLKKMSKAQEGIRVFERIPTRAIIPAKTQTLGDIVTEIVANVDNNRVILIGEQHDRFEHHLNQLLLIKKLKKAGYQVAIGMEMFQQPYQQALDDYLSGNINESEFLTQSKYFEKWRYDYNYYKPIIDYAVKQKIPLIALNIEGDISRHVSKKGIHSLDEEQQKQLPKELDLSNRQYRSDLKSVFKMHTRLDQYLSKQETEEHSQDNDDKFNYFFQSQTLWDESMAQASATFLKNNPNHILVILAGNGHLRYRYGIADRIQRMSNLRPIVIVQDEELDATIADYNLLNTDISGEITPQIGIYLDTKTTDKVLVTKVVKAGVGDNAGIEKGDIILSIDGKSIKSFSDLKLALLYVDSGKPVSVKVERDKKVLNKQFNFSPSASPHGELMHGKHTLK